MYRATENRQQSLPRRLGAREAAWLMAGLILVGNVTQSFAWRQQAQPPTQSEHFRFIGENSGRSAGHGAQNIDFGHYRAEDGVSVERDVESYTSENEARSRLQILITRASKVIERGNKKTRDGRQIGERVQFLARNSKGRPLNTIAWTNGSKVFLLSSESLRHVLDFEQQYDSSVSSKDAQAFHP